MSWKRLNNIAQLYQKPRLTTMYLSSLQKYLILMLLLAVLLKKSTLMNVEYRGKGFLPFSSVFTAFGVTYEKREGVQNYISEDTQHPLPNKTRILLNRFNSILSSQKVSVCFYL